MATPIPKPNYVIVWLDKYIGLMGSNMRLKCSVGGQIDPYSKFPVSPERDMIERLTQVYTDVQDSFQSIPDNLKAFHESNECLNYIDTMIKEKKKIFFITSGTMGKEIVSDIINKYSSLETIYVFCCHGQAHVEWSFDCLEKGISCIMIDFPSDLLVRLMRDVAEYFITQGNTELGLDNTLAYSAIYYFNWAKLLLERANNYTGTKMYDRISYVIDRIEFTEKQIKQSSDYGNNHAVSSE
ncbi:hypothetical protein I4U23_007238 [Adineta vaga]|nr:hypothetical protein I4U23_007238 [Adineta vaga]